jgi:hypothetical protein
MIPGTVNPAELAKTGVNGIATLVISAPMVPPCLVRAAEKNLPMPEAYE